MRRAAILAVAAVAAITGGSFLFAWTWHLSWFTGLYCALGTAATVGCEETPRSTAGRVAVILIVVTAVPLLAGTFAELTSIRLATWWHRKHGQHIEEHLRQHIDERHNALVEHLTRQDEAMRDLKGHSP